MQEPNDLKSLNDQNEGPETFIDSETIQSIVGEPACFQLLS